MSKIRQISHHHKNKVVIAPIRFDFLNIPGTAQAQKPNGATLICNMGIIKTKGWLEITNTVLIYFSQFEYENQDKVNEDKNPKGKTNAPLILQGGIFDQFVSTNKIQVSGATIYIHNLYFQNLHRCCYH